MLAAKRQVAAEAAALQSCPPPSVSQVNKLTSATQPAKQTSALMTAEPRMTPLWAAPEVLRYERVGVKVRRRHAVCRRGSTVGRAAWLGGVQVIVERGGERMTTAIPLSGSNIHQADIWSYGVLVWEIASGQDITRYAPLALSRLGGSGVRLGVEAAATACLVCLAVCLAVQPQVGRHSLLGLLCSGAASSCALSLLPSPAHPSSAHRARRRAGAGGRAPPLPCRPRRRSWLATSLPPAPKWTQSCAPTRLSWWSGCGAARSAAAAPCDGSLHADGGRAAAEGAAVAAAVQQLHRVVL